MALAGRLGDDHDLSRRGREYANEVVFGTRWPITDSHVDLEGVTFETSTRMKRRHGVCASDGSGNCTIRLSAETAKRGGFEAIEETVRHELVHVYQHQTADVETGHGESFKRWVEPLALSGRCTSHYERQPAEYKYRLYCQNGCGFVGGRHRFSSVVRRAITGSQVCGHCKSSLRVETDDGVMQECPSSRS